MNLLLIMLAFLAGVAIGLSYFGGLRWTVDRLQTSQNPMAFYLASFIARLAVVMGLVILALQVGPLFLVVATVGFFAARLFLVARTSRWKIAPGSKRATV